MLVIKLVMRFGSWWMAMERRHSLAKYGAPAHEKLRVDYYQDLIRRVNAGETDY